MLFWFLSVGVAVTFSATGTDSSLSGSTTDTTTYNPWSAPSSTVCVLRYGSTTTTGTDGTVTRTPLISRTGADCEGKTDCNNFFTKFCGVDGTGTTCTGKTTSALWPTPVEAGTSKDGAKVYACSCPCKPTDGTGIVDDGTSETRTIVCCSDGQNAKPMEKTECARMSGTEVDKSQCSQTGTDVCFAIYDPVCAADGTKYPNACEAKKAGVTDLVPCRDSCGCTKELRPVCGKVGTELKTFDNPCILKCAMSQNQNIMFVSEGPCPTTRPCLDDDTRTDPVCDVATSTTYGSLRTCKCAGKCNGDAGTAYTKGRCTTGTTCVCPEFVTNTRPICRSTPTLKQTIRRVCRAFCDGLIDVSRDSNTGALTITKKETDQSITITKGVCSTDENNCLVRDDSRINCDESKDVPQLPYVKLSFRFKMCYSDRLSRHMLFSAIREAAGRVLYKQCGLTPQVTDRILIVKFESLTLKTLAEPTRTQTATCTAGDAFAVSIAVYVADFPRATAIKQCITSFDTSNVDIRQVLADRIKEACNKADSRSDCTCKTTDTQLTSFTCDRTSSSCSDCTCTSTNTDPVIGTGDVVPDTAYGAELIVGDADGTVDSTTTITEKSVPGSAFRVSMVAVFVMVIVNILF